MQILIISLLMLFKVRVLQCSAAYRSAEETLRTAVWNGYNANIRPTASNDIKIQLNLLSIVDLDSSSHKLTATGWLTVIWMDERLNWTPTSFGDVSVLTAKETDVWRPELVIENSADSFSVISDDNLLVRIYDDQVVIWEPTQFMRVHCTQDMTYYPFDKHKCEIILSSWSNDHSETSFVALDSTINLDSYQSSAEWDISDSTNVSTSQVVRYIDTKNRTYSKITFSMTLNRRQDLHGLFLFLPCILISILSLLMFAWPADGADKATYCATVTLSYLVYVNMAMSFIPASSSVPVFAVYMAVVFIIIIVECVCAAFVLPLYFREPDLPITSPFFGISRFLSSKLTELHDEDNIEIPITPEQRIRTSHDDNIPNGIGTQSNMSVLGQKLPPMNTAYIKGRLVNNKVRPRSETSVKSVKSNTPVETKVSPVKQENPWKELATFLDCAFLLVFIIVTIILHLIFLIFLSIGGSKSLS